MKLSFVCSASIFFSFLFCTDFKEDKISVLIIRTPIANTVAFSREEFWSTSDLFERIDINGVILANVLKSKFSAFEPAEEDDIDRKTAFIYETHPGEKDTLYSDIFFSQWDIHGKIYNDKAGFFKDLFRPFVTAR